MSYNYASNALNNLQINRVLMVETGRYNPVYSRPYETNISGAVMNNLVERIVNTGGKKVTGSLLNGISAEIAAPSAIPHHAINISGGWDERRIRFIIEVQFTLSTGATGFYYIQGYTSHAGVTPNGAVDPNMEFVINSYTSVNRIQTLTPTGLQYIDRIEDTAQVFTGIDGTLQSHSTMTYGLRPEDVFKGIQSSFLQGGATVAGFGDAIDFRPNLGSKPNHSKRANNIPSQYVGEIVNSYLIGQDLSSFGQGQEDIMSRTLHVTMEPSVAQNFFFNVLSQVRHQLTNRFTWRDLQQIDPSVDAKSQYITLGSATKMSPTPVADPSMTAYWSGSDRITQMASLLSAAVPGLMMAFMIQKVHFRSTNHDATGMVNTVVIDVKSMVNLDMRRNVELFIHQLETEIIRDITMNGQDSYMLDMSCDIFGDTWINLSLGAEPMTQFVVPSFCDSLYSPVVTNNSDHYNHIAFDFNQLVTNVAEEVNSYGSRYESSIRVAAGI